MRKCPQVGRVTLNCRRPSLAKQTEIGNPNEFKLSKFGQSRNAPFHPQKLGNATQLMVAGKPFVVFGG